jgi:hypothetical protein
MKTCILHSRGRGRFEIFHNSSLILPISKDEKHIPHAEGAESRIVIDTVRKVDNHLHLSLPPPSNDR